MATNPQGAKQPAPSTPKKQAAVRGLESVMLRNEFYRDKFRAMAIATPLLVVALMISIALNVVLATRKAERDYFAVDQAGRITPIVALSEPYVTPAFLLNWVSETITRAYSFDAQNMQRQIGDLQPNFTPEGYEQYVQSLSSAGILDLVKKNLLIVSATPLGTPVVNRTGSINGAMLWEVRMPVLVQYRSATQLAERRLMVDVVVMRRQTLEAPSGIGVSRFAAADM